VASEELAGQGNAGGGTEPPGPAAAQRLRLALRFPGKPALEGRVSVHVVVEDVGEADARAPTLFETEVRELAIGPDGSIAPLEVAIPATEAIARAMAPAIRVHVDRGATGTLTEGDFINPAIVRLPDAEEAHCDVALVEVR
jgi:hypothetical protein